MDAFSTESFGINFMVTSHYGYGKTRDVPACKNLLDEAIQFAVLRCTKSCGTFTQGEHV